MSIRRLFLVRHGETEGESSIRYFGSTDVALSAEGRDQMRRVAANFSASPPDLFLASTLRRSWSAASILSGGNSIRIERDLREIHFGRWEGLTREEIEAQDPALYQDWQGGAEGFDYPGGEPRADFRTRVGEAIDRALRSPGHTAVAALHKGVIREIVRHLTGEELDADRPALGQCIALTVRGDGNWKMGQKSSDPAGVNEEAA